MIRTTRFQIALILGFFCISILTGFVLLKRSNDEKIGIVISGIEAEKKDQLDRIIDSKSKNLLTHTFDYSYWDEMVNFVRTGDPVWAKENIENSIPSYNIDYVWVYRTDFSLVYSITRNGMSPLPDFPFDLATLKEISKKGKIQHFFIQPDNEVIEISMATIHPTSDIERRTPVQGYYFAGRRWNNDYIKEIELLTESKIQISGSDTIDRTDKQQHRTKYSIENTKELTGWNDRPIAKITSTSDLEIFNVLSTMTDRKYLWGVTISAIFMLILLAFFGLNVYYPMRLLSHSLENENPDYIKSLLSKNDEFGQISVLINKFFIQKNDLIEEINERIAIENQLRKLTIAIEQSPNAIIITNKDGYIEYVNPKYSEMTCLSLTESIGKIPGYFLPEKISKEKFDQIWKTINSGLIWQGEFSCTKETGEVFFESAVITPISEREGKIVNFLIIKEDITEKRRNELTRQILFKISKAGATCKNLDELIDQIKINLKELINVDNFYIAIYDKENDSFNLPHFQDQKDEVYSFNASRTLTEYVFKNKKQLCGKKADIEKLIKEGVVDLVGTPAKIWLGFPLIHNDEAFGVFVVQSYENEKAFSDNDQKMLEFISNEISQTIIQKKTDGEIRAALEKAEVSDKLKSAFLANMSHEIRTPLNSILGFSELLTDPEIGPSNQEDFVKNIKNSGKQLLSIISDILDYSLIEAGQLTLFKSTFCVEKVILDVYSEYIPLAQEKGFEFIIEPSVYLTETVIEKDKNRFRQSIANLVNNAFKFTKAGTIKIGYKLLDNGFTFSVEDSGIGIIDEFKPFVFERFQQAEKLKSRNYGGNGLGLAISKNLVERMGGTIGYESTAGVGSTFYISMPI